ncbi:MgtC/SapB family protein [Paracoccus xiamenensis]|uniref:MgtC/SapB family protein n=1 Tax=Paracoccus xiamenensis TaxID=2714901 RepID=UPI001409D31B|nr:MgtC/SapB family protein [Paracoccus xiamenensis]NHF72456.1 MgtC/SapB family protein [Paracoccus xiamenensis]
MERVLEYIGHLESMSELDATLRMSAALFLGALIGWEREANARAAGLRTHMLISLAAALFTIIAMELTHIEGDPQAAMAYDPGRLIEAVTSGVAFLAAGSIVINGMNVRGVTTGASMWLVGAIGLACGTGDLLLASMATLMALIVLWLVRISIKPIAQNGASLETQPDPNGQDQ